VDAHIGKKIFLLDHTNASDVYSYERAVYRSFCHVKNLDHIWSIDHKTRTIRTKIPYEDQEVYIARLGERVVAGAALNFCLEKPFQLEMEGFTIDRSGNGYCEILQMFCQIDVAGGKPLLQELAEHFLGKLIARNVTRLYGTCSPKLVTRYRRVGLQVIGERVHHGEKVFLLEINFDKSKLFPGLP
jgi:hypothetical protein